MAGVAQDRSPYEAPVRSYAAGKSLTEVAAEFELPVSTVRHHVVKAGLLRSRGDGVRMAAAAGRIGAGLRGKSRTFSPSHKDAISASRRAWAETHACGLSQKPNGYVEHTRGVHKGRSEHVVLMEQRLGRRLLPDEHVHHIDGVRSNNHPDNLALVTRSGHARLHRFQEKLARSGGKAS